MKLRAATLADADFMLAWRNAPSTRQYALNRGKIATATHLTWLTKTLQSADVHLFIAEHNQLACGVLRYDVTGTEATVSLYLDPKQTGQKLGLHILRQGTHWVAANLPAVQRIHAQILPDNVASIKTFTKAGYLAQHSCYTLAINSTP